MFIGVYCLPNAVSAEAWAAWAQAIVSAVAARIALWAAFIMRDTANAANEGATRRATFDHTRALSEAAKNIATQLSFGAMPGIVREWVVGQPIGPQQTLVLDFFNALETLILAVETGAADAKVAARYLDQLIQNPNEIRSTIAAFRGIGFSSETYEHVERYFDARGASGTVL